MLQCNRCGSVAHVQLYNDCPICSANTALCENCHAVHQVEIQHEWLREGLTNGQI